MKIFTDRVVRLETMVIAAVLLAIIISGQLVVIGLADDYKQNMIAHDYAIAAYLSRNGLDRYQIARAFSSEKSNADMKTGQELLETAGYTSSVQNSLLPEVRRFYREYALLMLFIPIAFSAIIAAVFYHFALQRDKRLEKAGGEIMRFMDGDTDIRLEDSDEGSLSRLFASVNIMATSLTAHIEKEKENREFLKDTISDISHQLKTPLAALKIYNEIIRDEKTGNDVVESFTSKSERELERMENLVQNLLKLARLDAGTIELEKSPHNLKVLLEECVNGFFTRAKLEGKFIRLHCDDHVSLNLDESWLAEAIGNLIKNALDHSNAGQGMEISCAETAVAIIITIRDNGAGIHPEDIHHIFKRFYRSGYSQERQGVGIGLSLSKAIVEKHGGTITVQSQPGNGTAFELLFPKLSNL